MGDVTVELDEEVPKQDSSLEPLPEPLLIILSPPPPYLPLPGEPTMFWHKWLKAFEHYIEVLGQDKLVDSTKCALLQNCLGPEGQHIFTSLIHSETTYSAAISVLTEELLSPCNYGDLQEKLILDQLIAKTSCPQLRDRLLLEKEPLTLAAALVISREVESALNESEQFGFHEVSVDIGDDLDPPVQRKAKRGRPRRGEERAKTKPPLTKTQSKPSNYKDNYYYSSDKLYYSDENDETDQAKTRNNVDNRASISPQRMKEESYNKSDDADAESGKRDKVDIKTEDKDSDEAKSQDGASRIDDSISKTKAKGHFCPICVNRCFRGANKLARHMRTHTKEKPFTCPVCALTFSQSYHMTRHLRNQHGLGQYICPKCGKNLSSCVFLQLTALKYHLRTHTEERPYQCSCCIETFEEKDALEQHCLKHRKFKKEKPYSCTRCDYAFATLGELTEHMTSHEGEQPSNCPICGKTFLNKNKLEKHLTIHTGERRHLCSICGNGFPSAASLKLHIHIHTGEKPFKCSGE
uniref:C2H2-type domain-containing protein n=1 Tax=Anabas testudineus TaxID=64144 RepID=A0A7N6F709_ANATE